MSPRTRFRTEMARRGYTNNSSDMFFRLFQFPSSSSSASTANSPPTSAPVQTSSSGLSSPFRLFNLGNSSNNSANNSSHTSSGTRRHISHQSHRQNSGGHRLRNRETRHNDVSTSPIGDLDSDLTSDDDEQSWNHNFNSLAHSLPFFFRNAR